jgi:hypothetical protein
MDTVFYSLYASMITGIGWMYIVLCFALCVMLGLYVFLNGKD